MTIDDGDDDDAHGACGAFAGAALLLPAHAGLFSREREREMIIKLIYIFSLYSPTSCVSYIYIYITPI